MNPTDPRLRRDLTAARYLDALERDDFDTTAALWQLALTDPELGAILRETHAGLIEEQAREATAAAETALTAAVEAHLPSAEIVRPAAAVVTVADVAEELFRHAPNRLPAEAHSLNERLRTSAEPLPSNLGLPQLTTWAETLFGPAPPEYWKAFRQAAVKLELRRAAEAEYQLAARRAPRPEDKS
jgi:hypothetical protein